MVCGVPFLFNVCTVAMGSLKYILNLLHWLVVGAISTGVFSYVDDDCCGLMGKSFVLVRFWLCRI